MKKAEDLVAKILSYMMINGKLGDPVKDEDILSFVKDFEADIREDQDKKTRHSYIKANIIEGFTDPHVSAIRRAIAFWNNIILEGPNKDLIIDFYSAAIDSRGGTYGVAIVANFAPVPSKGIIALDKSDLDDLDRKSILADVIKHEIGHVLGFGSSWKSKGLLGPRGYTGSHALKEYSEMTGKEQSYIPVEDDGLDGTRNVHWEESIFDDELMTGYIGDGVNPLSRMTIASLEDLGYTVSYNIDQ